MAMAFWPETFPTVHAKGQRCKSQGLSKARLDGPWAIWSDGWQPCLWQGGWNLMILVVPSNPGYPKKVWTWAWISAGTLVLAAVWSTPCRNCVWWQSMKEALLKKRKMWDNIRLWREKNEEWKDRTKSRWKDGRKCLLEPNYGTNLWQMHTPKRLKRIGYCEKGITQHTCHHIPSKVCHH